MFLLYPTNYKKAALWGIKNGNYFHLIAAARASAYTAGMGYSA